jgi:DNA-binding CsgD family transcriptional regulator
LEEVRRLRRAENCHAVVLAGHQGVGKTRVAVEAVRLAEEDGSIVARATATRSARNIPFGALASLLPAVDYAAGAVDDPADLLRRYRAALLQEADGRPFLLLVDDAHLLDDASATLVHQLAVGRAAFVLATIRTGEPVPDSIVALWKDGLGERIDVGGLSGEAIEELLTTTLHGPVDGATIARLAVRCQGNVLFLRELVYGAFQRGDLSNDRGIWRLTESLFPSDRLLELVGARLSGLTQEEHVFLEFLATGEPLEPSQLEPIGGLALAEGLEDQGLVVSEFSGKRLLVRLGHPLYGEVLRSRIPATRIRRIARHLAESVEATGARRREDVLRIATWRLDGGGARADLMLEAATMARWRYDFPLAERLARAAVECGAGFDAALLAASLASLQGRAEADAELLDLASQARTDVQRAQAAIAAVDHFGFYRADPDRGLQVAEQAEQSIEDPTWRAEITARRAGITVYVSGPRACAEIAEPLLEQAQGGGMVWACLAASESLRRLGRLDDAMAAASKGHRAHLELTTPQRWYPWFHLHFHGLALAYAGYVTDAEAAARQQYQQALQDGSIEAQAWWALHFAQLVGEHGRIATAARLAREALALFHQLSQPMFARQCALFLSLSQALAGKTADAAEALAEVDALAVRPEMHMEVDLLQARAWTQVAAGNLPEAKTILAKAVDLGEEVGDVVSAASALHALARLGSAKTVSDRLADLTAQIDGEFAAAWATHAAGLATGDPKVLEEVSRSFEGMGADLLAAEAAADAAVAWRRAGSRRQAAASERQAASIAARCEGASTPPLQAIEARAVLTPAEREAALLAANGASNKDIARQLNVSVRSVENRLQHAYEKLGVSSREDLADALEVVRSD